MNLFYPLEVFVGWLVENIFFIPLDTVLAEVARFFIFDLIKIFLLLLVIIFSVSIVRTFLPPEKIRNILSRRKSYVGHILAAGLGIITPFCTCSAIPLFLGMIEAGVPLGITFSFLVASPMINEVAIVLLFGMFGWRITCLYILSGFLIAVFSGIIIGKLKVENLVADFVYKNRIEAQDYKIKMNRRDRFDYAINYTKDIIKKVWPYLVVGIGLGAWIHGYVPTDFLVFYAGKDNWLAVPFATILGIPLYSNAAGIIPLVGVLTEKGVSIGTALAFMMAVTGLSLPEFMILKKVMKVKLLLIFGGVVGLGIIFTGYLFNFILR